MALGAEHSPEGASVHLVVGCLNLNSQDDQSNGPRKARTWRKTLYGYHGQDQKRQAVEENVQRIRTTECAGQEPQSEYEDGQQDGARLTSEILVCGVILEGSSGPSPIQAHSNGCQPQDGKAEDEHVRHGLDDEVESSSRGVTEALEKCGAVEEQEDAIGKRDGRQHEQPGTAFREVPDGVCDAQDGDSGGQAQAELRRYHQHEEESGGKRQHAAGHTAHVCCPKQNGHWQSKLTQGVVGTEEGMERFCTAEHEREAGALAGAGAAGLRRTKPGRCQARSSL